MTKRCEVEPDGNHTSFGPGDGRPENAVKHIGPSGGNFPGEPIQPENRKGKGDPVFDPGRDLPGTTLSAR